MVVRARGGRDRRGRRREVRWRRHADLGGERIHHVCLSTRSLPRRQSSTVGRCLWDRIVPPSLPRHLAQIVALFLRSGEFLLKKGIFLAQLFVLLLQSLGDILQGHIAFDFPLLVLLYSSLEFCELGLLAFTKGTLSRPKNLVRTCQHV